MNEWDVTVSYFRNLFFSSVYSSFALETWLYVHCCTLIHSLLSFLQLIFFDCRRSIIFHGSLHYSYLRQQNGQMQSSGEDESSNVSLIAIWASYIFFFWQNNFHRSSWLLNKSCQFFFDFQRNCHVIERWFGVTNFNRRWISDVGSLLFSFVAVVWCLLIFILSNYCYFSLFVCIIRVCSRLPIGK